MQVQGAFILVCAPAHDAILIEAPADSLMEYVKTD